MVVSRGGEPFLLLELPSELASKQIKCGRPILCGPGGLADRFSQFPPFLLSSSWRQTSTFSEPSEQTPNYKLQSTYHKPMLCIDTIDLVMHSCYHLINSVNMSKTLPSKGYAEVVVTQQAPHLLHENRLTSVVEISFLLKYT